MHFPIVSDGEHLFMYPLAIWMYSLEIHLFSFPAWFLIGFFVPIELCKCFIYFDHQSLNWNTICQSFLPFCRLFFILLFLFLCRSFKSDIVTFVDFCICCEIGSRSIFFFFLLKVTIQFTQNHLLKSLLFPHCRAVSILLSIQWPYMCGSVSWFSVHTDLTLVW